MADRQGQVTYLLKTYAATHGDDAARAGRFLPGVGRFPVAACLRK